MPIDELNLFRSGTLVPEKGLMSGIKTLWAFPHGVFIVVRVGRGFGELR